MQGTWTWSYPNVVLPIGSVPYDGSLFQSTETGTLSLGPASGEWTVELPSAIVGCAGGTPQYAPKAAGIALVQTYPNGACVLYEYRDGHYQPYWTAGTSAAGASVGPFWGSGSFR